MENLMLDLIDDFLNIDEEQKEVWRVKDDVAADWCLDKIIESKVAFRRFEIAANTKIAQIQHSLKKEQDRVNNEVSFFESKLREYFETVEKFAKETKTMKKYKLPSGELKLTKSKVVLEYDKTKLLDYAEQFEDGEMDEYIKTTKEFKWAEFKKNLEIKDKYILNKETGEIVEIEGLKLETKQEEFIVEV